jgi:hypothetical protein
VIAVATQNRHQKGLLLGLQKSNPEGENSALRIGAEGRDVFPFNMFIASLASRPSSLAFC